MHNASKILSMLVAVKGEKTPSSKKKKEKKKKRNS